MERETILEVNDLDITFELRGKRLHAIRGISLELYKGEILAIVGESGSGKSVFTKSFMGLLDKNGSVSGGKAVYYGSDDKVPVELTGIKKEKDWLKLRGHVIAMIM
jgi:oligopeptide transport system ATP-binding protein